MKRLPLILFLLTVLFVSSAGQALALTLTKIGTTTVPSNSISSWFYQGSNPVFTGTTDPSAAVSIGIAGVSNTATADSAGAWSFTPTTLGQTGTYPIQISSGTQSMAFSLDITASGASTAAGGLSGSKGGTMSGSVQSPGTLPQTGGIADTIGLIGAGLLLVVSGTLFYWKVLPRLLFIDDLEDDQQ